ncbi:hypothetical protein PHSY_007211 [Pseudozyma hubeiensis SY62]|uniref:Uncharacterized protein n=1 Tax=Pseudozyma hubeiensis (strain SY62) TaxID=1305764 RepID=R9PE04_PSEHS|nr:hypothetical protein PHSY_007211 [Pseudozyma hubeiensis SY62]GAC99608.1 hypothetical protein PHSY_007211 [Pseudozyma hubeiensis SY62]
MARQIDGDWIDLCNCLSIPLVVRVIESDVMLARRKYLYEKHTLVVDAAVDAALLCRSLAVQHTHNRTHTRKANRQPPLLRGDRGLLELILKPLKRISEAGIETENEVEAVCIWLRFSFRHTRGEKEE